jgi:hypothetical protein
MEAVPPDFFILRFWSRGKHLCGVHLATSHGQNRIDGGNGDVVPSIIGVITGDTARVTYQSSFGGTGTAKIRVHRGNLQWDVVEGTGESYIPDHEILPRTRDEVWNREWRNWTTPQGCGD